MKEYLSDLKFTVGLILIIFLMILYNMNYFLSEETISSIKLIKPDTIEKNSSNFIKE